MKDYVEKQAAATIPVLPKEHRKYQTMNLDDAYENGWYDALECVEKLPPADVRPVVRGKWTLNKDGSGTCSECGFVQNSCWDLDNWDNFCHHCGADMRGETNGGD